ncbi:MAG: hypothetical protein ACE5KU_05145 [Nitrososphaerales archaeon]
MRKRLYSFIVGKKLAERLNIGLGEALNVDSYEFTVSGIYLGPTPQRTKA